MTVKLWKNKRSSIYTKEIPYKTIIAKRPNFYKQDSKIIISRLKRTWTISIDQYTKLFWEKPCFNPKIKFFRIIEVANINKYRHINKRKLFNQVFMGLSWLIKEAKVYHNYININNIISYKNKTGCKIENIFFDWEIKLKNQEYHYKNYITPDATFNLDDKKTYFIETDLWTESYNIVKEKDESYFEFLKLNIEKDQEFKIILFSTPTRLYWYKQRKIFENLDMYNLIYYYPIVH